MSEPRIGAVTAATDLITAATDLIGHTGAESFELRYSDDGEPLAWIAVAGWKRSGGTIYEVGAGLDPVRAVMRLLDATVDGGRCSHCQRPTGVSDDFDSMPMDELICWYQYDPELKKFRRGCE